MNARLAETNLAPSAPSFHGRGWFGGEFSEVRCLLLRRSDRLTSAEVTDRADLQDRHFQTDHLMADLQERSIRGGAITLAAQPIRFALQLASTVVLARLLSPADFGLVAMVTVVTGFVAMFNNFGIGMAVLHRDDLSHAQLSTLFWFNLALSSLLTLGTCAAAPAISWIYGEPRLILLTVALSTPLLLGAIGAQHASLLGRQMRFGTQVTNGVAAQLASVAAAITMACVGFGYWALVALPVVQRFVASALAWMQCDWRPGRPRLGSGIRPMLRMGRHVQGVDLSYYLITSADNALLGWYHGPAVVGIYARAYQLLTMPASFITMPATSFVLPALCRLRSTPDAYRDFFRSAVESIALLAMPGVAFCFVASAEVVRAALGPQWDYAATLFRLLSPAAMLATIGVVPGWVCISHGLVHRQFTWVAGSLPCFLLAFGLALPFGAAGVAFACSLVFVAYFLGAIVYCLQPTCVGFHDVCAATWRPATASIGTAFMLYLVMASGRIPLNPLSRLSALLTVFLLGYALLLIVLPGSARLRARLTTVWTACKATPLAAN